MSKIDEQTLIEHLSEFRKRLIVIIVFFIIAFLISLVFCSNIYKLLTASFNQKLVVLGPNDILSIYLMLAGICAFSLTLPFASYQIWAFVRPALEEREAKVVLSYVPATFILFIAGLCFGFFFITPALLNVLLSFGDDLFNIQLTANSYLTFIIHTSLPLGIIFELPVIVAFLTSLHILTPQYLIKNRRYGYFILLVLAVVLTPADFISDLTMAAPLILLYEVSILVCKYIYKKRRNY
ncbi:twin-arginine translocase subunit TatC [Leptotrichia hongkongensis]|jgi:twin arginine-targeting protein translocase tatC|uniref:twin-arginine translocase subunit TatC n=1 Tax=Leptotrichia hongkongensis TaxID=554406 RepID=UPI0035A91934